MSESETYNRGHIASTRWRDSRKEAPNAQEGGHSLTRASKKAQTVDGMSAEHVSQVDLQHRITVQRDQIQVTHSLNSFTISNVVSAKKELQR